MDSQTLSLLIIIGLPPAAIEFLALVWGRGRLRLILALAVPVLPLGILLWLLLTAQGPGDPFARLGFVAFAFVLTGGALLGAVLGGVVVLIRNLRRKRAA